MHLNQSKRLDQKLLITAVGTGPVIPYTDMLMLQESSSITAPKPIV